MKINKIIIFTFLSLFFIIGANIVLAENDEEDRNGNNIQPVVVPVVPIVPVAPLVTAPTPAATTVSPIVTSQPTVEVKTIKTQTTEVIKDVLVDSDQDGVIDSLDLHPGEDDFAFTNDLNQNGVADDLEYLVGR